MVSALDRALQLALTGNGTDGGLMYILKVSGKEYTNIAGSYRDPDEAITALKKTMGVFESRFWAKRRASYDTTDDLQRQRDHLRSTGAYAALNLSRSVRTRSNSGH